VILFRLQLERGLWCNGSWDNRDPRCFKTFLTPRPDATPAFQLSVCLENLDLDIVSCIGVLKKIDMSELKYKPFFLSPFLCPPLPPKSYMVFLKVSQLVM
jgi:hypothetical protein